MFGGLYGGLVRLGIDLPVHDGLMDLHGPIMICGVFGTLISLERAVALGGRWPYLGPAAAAAGTALLIGGAAQWVGAALYLAAALALLAATIRIIVLQPALHNGVLAAGAACWACGNALWGAGVSVSALSGWWLSFLVLTIAGERLELSRLLRPPRSAELIFVAVTALVVIGAALGIEGQPGAAIAGLGFLGMVIWLARHDIATRTVRGRGRTRFFAAAMLSGYFWLGVAGLLLMGGTGLPMGYDMTLHAVLIGFVVSMVFGHALIILPAVAGIGLSYHRALYAPLMLLQISVAMRIGGGLFGLDALRSASGALTAGAIVLFALTLIGIRAFSER
jgi:hypothetical protein